MGAIKKQEKKLDAYHRKQLKRILNIRYPTKIKNKTLYKKTREKPLTQTIAQNRWKLFGHILRRDRLIPANQVMEAYFEPSKAGGFKGKKRITLPVTLNKDLESLNNKKQHLIDHSYCKRLKLNNKTDLEEIRQLAQDRVMWKELVYQMASLRTGDADDSDDSTAEGQ